MWGNTGRIAATVAVALAFGAVPANAAGTLDSFQPELYIQGCVGGNENIQWGQVTTAYRSGVIDRVDLPIWKYDDVGSMIVRIQNVTSGGAPGTTILGSGTIANSQLPQGHVGDWTPVTLSTPAPVTAGQRYAIVVTWAPVAEDDFAHSVWCGDDDPVPGFGGYFRKQGTGSWNPEDGVEDGTRGYRAYIDGPPTIPNVDQESNVVMIEHGCIGARSGLDTRRAQTFVAGRTGTLTRADLSLIALDGPVTQPLKVEVQTTDPLTGAPTDTVLATGSIPASGLTTQPAWLTATFDPGAAVTAGTRYALVISTEDENSWNWCSSRYSPYTQGARWQSFDILAEGWDQGGDGSYGFRTAVTEADTTDPVITVTTPAEGASYTQGQVVNASYSCTDEEGGSGLLACNGTVANGAAIDTATPGAKSVTVSAADNAGNTASKTVNYTVTGTEPLDTTDPTVTLTTPPDGAFYTQGQVVNADYACADNAGGSGIATCVGEVANGAPLDTATLGQHLFTVTATDVAGNDASRTHLYTVLPPPSEPQTRTVDDDKVQCPSAGFTTIQGAVNAAGPGDTINVCRGTYTEDVFVGAGKDDVSLFSITAAAAAVIKGQIVVTNGVDGVSIQRFRIEPNISHAGIAVAGEGTGVPLIRSNLIVGGATGINVSGGDVGAIRDNTLLNQTSFGVRVAPAAGQTSSAGVLSNTITGTPTSEGLVFSSNGAVLSALAFGNTISKHGVRGIGVTDVEAGITIRANNVFRNGEGLRVAGSPTALIENNKLSENTGAGIITSGSQATFTSNNARGNGGTDCVDTSTGGGTAGTGNTWTGNYGYEATPATICKK